MLRFPCVLCWPSYVDLWVGSEYCWVWMEHCSLPLCAPSQFSKHSFLGHHTDLMNGDNLCQVISGSLLTLSPWSQGALCHSPHTQNRCIEVQLSEWRRKQQHIPLLHGTYCEKIFETTTHCTCTQAIFDKHFDKRAASAGKYDIMARPVYNI